MNYRLSTYKLPVYLALAATLVTGCATQESVKQIGNRVSGLEGRMPNAERKIEDLGAQVKTLQEKPNAERTLAFKEGCKIDGRDINHLYNWLRGRVLPKYNDPDARADAEANSDMLTVGPTGRAGVYRSLPMEDGDKNCVASKGDFVFPDVVGGREKVGFEVPKGDLPEELRFLLLEVQGGKK